MVYLTEFNWAALALCPGNHIAVGSAHHRICQNPGKTPIQRWAEWQKRLPTRDELLSQWRWQPNANVGICLGPVSQLVGIDVDGPADEQLLKDMSQGDLPATLSFTTARGSRLLYRLEPGMAIKSRHAQAGNARVSILSHGTMTAMPPSWHRSGKQYRWKPGLSPQHVEAVPAPAWLWHQKQAHVAGAALGTEVIPEGERNWRMFKMACTLRRFGATVAEILAMVTLINRRCAPPLEEEELRTIARSAAKYTPGC